MNDEIPSNTTIINFTTYEENDDIEMGVTKKMTIINNAIPINKQAYLVCSLNSTIY